MKSSETELIHRFYTAFQQGDYVTMQTCYHPQATFHDPVFQTLDSRQVKAMWQMLLTSARDLRVTFSDVSAEGGTGSCLWHAHYTFSRTGRPVHNVVRSAFTFRDDKIFTQTDHFDFWRWSRQALGTTGLLLGWSPLVKNKVRGNAQQSLTKFMASNPLGSKQKA
jgi:ketosteroid isomerase-like protein